MSTLKYPLATEKSIRMIEASNTLIFVVDRSATKLDIKEAAEKTFTAKVRKVRTLVDNKGKKRAYVSFGNETPALDIATRLGLM